MSDGVSSGQRFTAHNPCPICGGYKEMPQGHGERCYGYRVRGGNFVYCTRSEFAGGMDEREGKGYLHKLTGTCKCGEEHGAADEEDAQNTPEMQEPTRPAPARSRGRPRSDGRIPLGEPKIWPLTETYGKVIGFKKRVDYGPKDKEFKLLGPDGSEGNIGIKPQFFPFWPIHLLNGHQELVACEGEKTADAINEALRERGLDHDILAVGWTGGASTFPATRPLSAFYKCDTVTIWPDNDSTGIELGRHIARNLGDKGIPNIRRVKIDDLPEKADAADLSVEEILARIDQAEPWEREDQFSIELVDLRNVESRPVEWLWENYIPLGALTSLEGDPGEGKTNIILDLISRVTRGDPMPGEPPTKRREPQRALYITIEDDDDTVIKPRLESFGCDFANFRSIHLAKDRKGEQRVFDFARDLPEFEQIVEDFKPALIAVDPIQSHIGKGTDANAQQAVREALMPLKLFTVRQNVALLFTRHFGKNQNPDVSLRGIGSQDWKAFVRSQLVVVKQKIDDDTEKRYLSCTKSNLAAREDLHSFEYVMQRPPNPMIAWVGETSATANQLVAPPDEEKGERKQSELQTLIMDELKIHRESIPEAERADDKGMPLKDIAENVGRTKPTTLTALRTLIGKDLVEATGGGFYRVRHDQ